MTWRAKFQNSNCHTKWHVQASQNNCHAHLIGHGELLMLTIRNGYRQQSFAYDYELNLRDSTSWPQEQECDHISHDDSKQRWRRCSLNPTMAATFDSSNCNKSRIKFAWPPPRSLVFERSHLNNKKFGRTCASAFAPAARQHLRAHLREMQIYNIYNLRICIGISATWARELHRHGMW